MTGRVAPAAYTRPPGVSLLFCSRSEIEAASAAEREAYYAIVESLLADPESFGFRRETNIDRQAEFAADRRQASFNGDWGS